MAIGSFSVGDLLTEEEYNNLPFEERMCFKLIDRATMLSRIVQLSQELRMYDEDDYDSSEESEEWTSSDGSTYTSGD